ncbi:DoxX family protein [Sphingobacterium hungaricum]|uniref:DoxX family protein n=1 Tax=Sphingobacterium hungaricum TaxID=2082723 RepID=A0A928UUY5_9SPHI|nr:DoxX family protein [Sphingobacterium hungaricum]MBE8713408.1 DoxX family protein [Sphingobacterium hungaricum]
MKNLSKYRDLGILIIRLGIGAMMLTHGVPKLLGGVDTWEKVGSSMGIFGIHFLPVVWGFLAAATETVGSILLILGLWTRPACLLLAFTMLVALSKHLAQGDGLSGASHAIEFFCVYLGLLFIGPGKYSVDKR